MTKGFGTLYVVATPIGNLADLSVRALDTLRGADWIAAEDTRHTQGLLSHYGVSARLLAAHEHNEEAAAAKIVDLLQAGETVALVSDAGTPGISDPGARIVARVRTAGAPVVPVPGPCAAVTALSASGFDAPQWLFCGFLPARPPARRAAIEAVSGLAATLVFYEAPHRIVEALAALAEGLGPERRVLIARELSKRFEDLHLGRLADAVAWLEADADHRRGEFVVVVEGREPAGSGDTDGAAEGERVLRILLADGLPVRQASSLAAAITGVAKKGLYARALAIRGEDSE